MVQYFKSLVVALLLSVCVCSVAKAASFDCNKATTETEIAICADQKLSALDDLMGYFWKALDPSGGLIIKQKEWLKERDNWSENTSGKSFVEHLRFQYFDQIKILVGEIDPKYLVKTFKSSNDWTVKQTQSSTAYVFNYDGDQFLAVPSQNKQYFEFIEHNYTDDACQISYSVSDLQLKISENCNQMFFFDQTYSSVNDLFFLSQTDEYFGRLEVYEGNLLSVSANYETGLAEVRQRVCNLGGGYDDIDCFLDPVIFTSQFETKKQFQLGHFSRKDLPCTSCRSDDNRLNPSNYFRQSNQGQHSFQDPNRYPNLTEKVTSLLLDIEQNNDGSNCDEILAGYSKILSSYTAIFSSFSSLREAFIDDTKFDFTLNNYLIYPDHSDSIISLSHVLAFLDSYSATEKIVSVWFNKFDEDTQKQLSYFSKYAVEYHQETGTLLDACFSDFEQIDFFVASFYRQETGEETKFLWKPINEYLDGFWERRSTDGTANQVQSILQLIAD
ncbi:hypothetical protein N9B69_00185 [Amylibacter sp.]|nr:hypothetical protein [Amylibacter sp.]